MKDVNTKTGAQTVQSRSYLVSLAERTARAGAALVGGVECVYPTEENAARE